jgi:hypothetical protein
MAGAITLGEVSARTTVLRIACRRCDRQGRYTVASLISRHGPAFTVPDVLRSISADCPRQSAATSVNDICGAYCPGLAALFGVSLGSPDSASCGSACSRALVR